MTVNPLAVQTVSASMSVNVSARVTAYYAGESDGLVLGQRVACGASEHRGCAFDNTFKERRVLAIAQAICDFRGKQASCGPLFLGIDTHAFSTSARASALEVLAINGVEVLLSKDNKYTATAAISRAILTYSRGWSGELAQRHCAYALAQSAGRKRVQVQPFSPWPGAGHRRRHVDGCCLISG